MIEEELINAEEHKMLQEEMFNELQLSLIIISISGVIFYFLLNISLENKIFFGLITIAITLFNLYYLNRFFSAWLDSTNINKLVFSGTITYKKRYIHEKKGYNTATCFISVRDSKTQKTLKFRVDESLYESVISHHEVKIFFSKRRKIVLSVEIIKR